MQISRSRRRREILDHAHDRLRVCLRLDPQARRVVWERLCRLVVLAVGLLVAARRTATSLYK
ncbi:hypothetical protein [Micromonospora craterilacus]|uniref:hypothetical protein n=1 Tax=Micromonospora craterilacus TaxID=1655439 RepID=UPI00131411B8|nr:hypothetical protein [Micromonospora craterilacus]